MTTGILLGVFFVGLITFHWLERFNPVIKGLRHGLARPDYVAEFTAALVDGPVLSSLTKIVAFWLITLAPQYADGLGRWPLLAQFAVFFIINDFGRYWLHRWYHEFNWLWRIHRVHHTVTEMDALSTFRVHVLEGVIKYGLLVLPFHLSGVSRWVILAYSSIDILKGFWHHANLRTYIGRLNYLLNSAELHWWHHSVDERGQRANYGSTLSIWDWLFGTAYWPKGKWPERIGVEGLEHFPKTYHEMLTSIRFDDQQAARAYQSATPPGVDTPQPAGAETATVKRQQATTWVV